MSKQKDFKKLFGCDDSDEENMQEKISNTSAVGNKKITETDDNNKQKHNRNNLENNTVTNEKEHLEGKRLKSSIHEHNKKRLKMDYIDEEKDKITQEGIDNETEVIKPSNMKSRQNDDSKEKVKLKKTEIGALVVKLLTPAYVEKRFESRETFKMLARNISHALHDKDEQEIKEYVTNFLNKNEAFTSHTTL